MINVQGKVDVPTIEKVVKGGYCVGCGGCGVATNNAITIERNALGYFQANLDGAESDDLQDGSAVCPFAAEADDENVLGKRLFLGKAKSFDSRVGYFNSLYAGRITDASRLERSSSGGITSYIITKLLQSGEIDGVIHVGGKTGADNALFDYVISETTEEIFCRTKSRYYSVSFADVLTRIRGNNKKYAFVGVPCFVKSIRLLCQQDPELQNQIAYTFALICGHMKSSAFAELLSWQLGVRPNALTGFDFRVKNIGLPASHYMVEANTRNGASQRAVSNELYGSNWGHTFFQLKACDFCDDITGELSDASFGDAWLPQYNADWRGTNIIVCRNKRIEELIEEARKSGAIVIDSLQPDEVVASQAGNYRHRWDGLSVRLQDTFRRKEWAPLKRIKPGTRKVTFLRKKIVRLRQTIALASHIAFFEAKRARNIDHFFKIVKPLTKQMQMFERLSVWLTVDFLKEKLFNPGFYLRKMRSRRQ